MKHFLILLLVASLATGCNNNKKEKDRGYDRKERDDYRAKEGDAEATDEKPSKTDFSSNTGDGWTEADLEKINQECLKSISGNEELGSTFCPCVVEKMQKKYSSYQDLDTRGTTAEGEKIGKECMLAIKGATGDNNSNITGGGGWPQVERTGFMTNCVKNAVAGGRSRLVANSYCECMLDIMESLYPDINDAGRLTESQVESIANKYKDRCLEEH